MLFRSLMRSLEIEFMPIARDKGLDLRFVACSLPVESDRSLLRRLLQNFISNAIKYTPRGRVLIGCRRRGDALEISIFDTGVGIPVQKRGEIFKEFHRLEQGARIARGLGLGLSIVERLARVLNHRIAISANVSGGSAFSVTVPVATAVNHTAAVTSATKKATHSLSRCACSAAGSEARDVVGVGWSRMLPVMVPLLQCASGRGGHRRVHPGGGPAAGPASSIAEGVGAPAGP